MDEDVRWREGGRYLAVLCTLPLVRTASTCADPHSSAVCLCVSVCVRMYGTCERWRGVGAIKPIVMKGKCVLN